MKILLNIFSILIVSSTISAAAIAADEDISSGLFHPVSCSGGAGIVIEQTPAMLAQTYLQYISPETKIEDGITMQDAFRVISDAVCSHKSGVIFHQHVIDGPTYGNSFHGKNTAPIQFAVELLTGQKKGWTKKSIESKSLAIADVGCGLGLSAVFLLSQVIEIYKREKWDFSSSSPIRLDLRDISPEHQPALQALVAIVNAAYGQYFHLTAGACDITAQPIAEENTYNLIFAFNIMHFIPEKKWETALAYIIFIMKKSGMLFVTTDAFHSVVDLSDFDYQKDTLENSAKELVAPFFSSIVYLRKANSLHLKRTRSCMSRNFSCIRFLQEGVEYKPGTEYTHEQLDLKCIEFLLENLIARRPKKTISVYLGEDDPVQELPISAIIDHIQTGKLIVEPECYTFDKALLERAVLDASKRALKKLELEWGGKLRLGKNGLPETVGLTFMKQ